MIEILNLGLRGHFEQREKSHNLVRTKLKTHHTKIPAFAGMC